MEIWIILIAASSLFWAIGKFWAYLQQRLVTKEENIRKAWEAIAVEKSNIEITIKKIDEDRKAIHSLAEEKSQGFPWLAKAYADYFNLRNLEIAKYMETKSHPAPTSAEKVREIAKKRRVIEEKLRIAQGVIEYYQNLFPFLEDFIGDIDDEILIKVLSRNIEEPIREIAEIGEDPVRIYLRLSKEEYDKLPVTERNQRALNSYWKRRKSKWQIGRDYERFLGYVYETNGYLVYYKGILEGFDDLGRDLICKKDNEAIIVQCKRWATYKTIHEKHINQLYGTSIKYKIDHPQETVRALLCTTTKLSERAKQFADHLSVGYAENYTFEMYPSIKCNVSKRTGEKIYHLPFDQQYDRTIIEEEKNECYVETVAEAEELGFRRAWRWKGPKEE
jgi:hypothetical protein